MKAVVAIKLSCNMCEKCCLQLVIHGGPQTSVVVQFKTSHPEIATVDSVTGLLEAKGLGNLVSCNSVVSSFSFSQLLN
jgi:hypothetical protein